VRARLAGLLLSEHLVLALSLAAFLALLPFVPGLGRPENLANLLSTLLPLLIAAIGQLLVLLTGGIDLSQTSTIALASVVGAWVMNANDGWLAGHPLAAPAALLAMLVTGAAVGLFNGLAVARLRLPAFIVTLTSMMFVSGLAVFLTRSRNINGLPPAFLALGRTAIALALALAVAALVHLVLSRSLYGRWIYAVGHNAVAARVSGVPVAGVTASVYAASGALAALASVLYTAQTETGSPVLGQRLLLDIVGATVIGGASLTGGRGSLAGTAAGVLFVKLLDNALDLLSLSNFGVMMAKGGVILAAALVDAARTRVLSARA
jgi:ribose/xylose/arabinose/galactoside ABC-type transport system permease subunit